MITTKTNGKTKGIGVTYKLKLYKRQPLDYTDYQYEYGQGENGVRPKTSNPRQDNGPFGEKIQPGMTQVLFDSVIVLICSPTRSNFTFLPERREYFPIPSHWRQPMKKGGFASFAQRCI
jgi:hypothetical protein